MRKNIFSEYFYLCATIISASVICISAVLLAVSAEFYKADKRNSLESIAKEVLGITAAGAEPGGFNTESLKEIYTDIADMSEADFTLFDSEGAALVCSEAPPCFNSEKKLGAQILELVTEEGYYELGKLQNYYDEPYFNIAYRIQVRGDIYYLFSKMSAGSLTRYLSRLLLLLGAVAAVTLSIVFVTVYVATKRLMTPIREMTLAARRFGEGDFSRKLHIADRNELGFLADTLNEMASSLEEIEETRKSFISNVSHEFKTPMTTIGGFIDGILDGTVPPEMHKHYLRIVSDEVTRLSRLVRSMLNISKYEAGELTVAKEYFDLMPGILRTALNFEHIIENKDVEVLGLTQDRFEVYADPDLLLQVMYNLIENAAKFVNKGGFIEFGFSQDEDSVTIKIKNSGKGLNENEINKVFDRFYKADESRGIDKTGVGLGLSIVSSIIKLHGGTILVRSEINEYVEFEINLVK